VLSCWSVGPAETEERRVEIQVNSDKNVPMDTQVIRFIGVEVNRVLRRFAGRLTRVEVHLSDVNSHKFGTHDKRCLIEARPARHRPLTASSGAPTINEAVAGTLAKLRRSLQTLFGRLGKPSEGMTKSNQPRIGLRRSMTTGGASSGNASVDGVSRATPRGTNRSSVAGKISASVEGLVHARGPKKKGIYQARRKSWPAR
jgi:hypothetical protein